MTNNGKGLVVLLEHVTDIPGQNFYKAQPHRLAFDGDFREQFNDKLHGGNGSLANPIGFVDKKYSSHDIPAASRRGSIPPSRSTCALPLCVISYARGLRYHRRVATQQESNIHYAKEK
jgi:hypothetical protein